ncbi:MAG: hypothetical protein JSR21_22175 [Proteobacteria bacterium]|nr:hypothetical protein [Pseudomonadota bacterium]
MGGRFLPVAAAALALPWALSGCATGPTRAQAMQTYIGQPVTVLIAGMGVPNRTFDANGVRFLAYDEQQIDVVPGSYGAPIWGVGPGFPGWGWGPPPMPPSIVTWSCQTTFQVQDDIVRAFTLRGNAC